MLNINNLCVGYPGTDVVKDACLTAKAGEITVLFGPNGCGKSTLLKAICGINKVSSGDMILQEENLRELSRQELARKITYLAQSRQIPDITVGRLVLHGRFPYLSYPRRYRKEDIQAAKIAMKQMDILELEDVSMEHLSGGQRQKAYIAMALAQDTDVILLDEPTTFLDIRYQLQLLRQARQLANRGKYVLMVVHDLDQAMNVADKLVLMDRGTVEIQGTPEEVFFSGKLEKIFGISLGRVENKKSWHYFYEEEKREDGRE